MTGRAVLLGRAFPTRSRPATLGCTRFQTLNGKVDLAIFCIDDHYLHILTLDQMLPNVANIGIGNLRDMYKTRLILGQGNKCAEIGDRFYFSL